MKITVITVCFNVAGVIEDTIKSVIAQTHHDVEYIIIDGGSMDGTVDIIRKYQREIDLFISEPDNGIYCAMNKGIAKSTGDYSLFMNAGDCFMNRNVLIEAVPFLTGEAVISGNEIDLRNGKIEDYSPSPAYLDFKFYCNSCLRHQATFIRTDLLKENLYDESLKIASDWKFWFEQLYIHHQSYKKMDVDICLFSRDGISTSDKTGLAMQEREKVILDYLGEKGLSRFHSFKRRNIFQHILYRINSRLSREWRLWKYRHHFRNIEHF